MAAAPFSPPKDDKPYDGFNKAMVEHCNIFKTSGFNTRAVHQGQGADPTTGAIIPPIFLTSTYVQESPGVHKGYDYTRAGNPSFTALEHQVASLESGKYATVFAAGLAGFTALLSDLRPGDAVVALSSCYGGTYRLLKEVYEPFGLKLFFIKVSDLEKLDDLFVETKPKMFIFETPTNPLLEVVDIEKVVDISKKRGVTTVVDNTFASPYHQQPLVYGADVVLHSSTKYLGGHSDVVGGAVVTNNEKIRDRLEFYRKCMGLNPSPFDCWLISRSIKTLGIRMERHAANALALAEYLSNHPAVARVYYPGLISNSEYPVASKQMKKGFSGIVSAEFNLTLKDTMAFIASMRVFSLAESLGGVESLVDHPASMTHASIPAEERKKIGLSDGLVRFSVGIENVEDQINDITSALALVFEK